MTIYDYNNLLVIELKELNKELKKLNKVTDLQKINKIKIKIQVTENHLEILKKVVGGKNNG